MEPNSNGVSNNEGVHHDKHLIKRQISMNSRGRRGSPLKFDDLEKTIIKRGA